MSGTNGTTPDGVGDQAKEFAEYQKRMRGATRFGTLLGEENKRGQKFAELPPWFKRVGLRTFEIESGIGVVRCCEPDYRIAEKMETADGDYNAALDTWGRSRKTDDKGVAIDQGDEKLEKALRVVETKQEEMRLEFTVRLIASIPDSWVNEGEEMVEGTFKVDAGAKIPAPGSVVKMGPKIHRLYLSLLPASLFSQIWAGHAIMALPPIPYEIEEGVRPS